jgi:hypothetical protein
MRLTDEETEQAARRLYATSLKKNWDAADDNAKQGIRQIVTEMARKMGERSPEALRVFMLWMGDDP